MQTVSFVLATYNRGAVVGDCLRRTLACADAALGAGKFSIIVVDNASTDATADVVAALARQRRELRLIRLTQNEGPVAKNHGLVGNRADILVMMDDDAYPLPGALLQMVRHFDEEPRLGAAVFDVTLPDGAKEAAAYRDVFIGAGAALRRSALEDAARITGEILPADFFMQAEEYDLSFRLIECGWQVQRFWDMPLMHLKAPGARIGQRTTGLDVRNNLFVLARYVREPVCRELAADWLARYWWMALARDAEAGVTPIHAEHGTHQQAFARGAQEGLTAWDRQRAKGRELSPPAEERIFKWTDIQTRMRRAKEQMGLRRIAFGDLGKNMLAFHRAAAAAGLQVAAVLDDALGAPGRHYRGIPLMQREAFEADGARVDAVILTALSPVHAARRAAAWRRVIGGVEVVDLFCRRAAATPAAAGVR